MADSTQTDSALREGEGRETLRSFKAPIDLVLDAWQDLFMPVLEILNPQLASGVIIFANDLDTCPRIQFAELSHPSVRKEGV